MPANESLPTKRSGSEVTAKATAGITGKRFVKISANRTGGGVGGLSTDLANVPQVAQCVAGDRSYGVSKYDAANGSLLGVHTEPGIHIPVTSGAAITAGQEVQSDAAGKAIPLAAGKANGMAVSSAGGADVDVEIKLY